MHRRILPLKERLTGITRARPFTAELPHAPATPPLHETADAKALHNLLGSLSAVIADVQVKRQRTISELAQTSVELGVAIAERLIGSTIALDRQRLDLIVLTSLERIQSTRSVAIKAHPDDVILLQRQVQDNAALERYRASLTFQPDDACQRGQIKFEADDLFVEWDTQRSLAELRGALLDEVFTDE